MCVCLRASALCVLVCVDSYVIMCANFVILKRQYIVKNPICTLMIRLHVQSWSGAMQHTLRASAGAGAGAEHMRGCLIGCWKICVEKLKQSNGEWKIVVWHFRAIFRLHRYWGEFCNICGQAIKFQDVEVLIVNFTKLISFFFVFFICFSYFCGFYVIW